MELVPVSELLRRVRPTLWPSAAPLIPPPTADEIEAAREVLATADDWTKLFYATRYPQYFRDLEPDPHPPVLRD
ncbi:MAG: hypothetical protein Q8S20_08100 [Sulfuritalea sp.]|nr:hypothetical protein [Sulfuritalea sp.]